MTLSLSVFLAVGAVCALAFVLVKIRKGQIQTADAVFWFLLAAAFVVLAIFPRIAYWCSELLGVESPANFIFLCVVAILFVKVLLQSVEIARVKSKLASLTQEVALREHDQDSMASQEAYPIAEGIAQEAPPWESNEAEE